MDGEGKQKKKRGVIGPSVASWPHLRLFSFRVCAFYWRFFSVCLLVQESLEQLVRDAQMNGVQHIPTRPMIRSHAGNPQPPAPKEEGKEDYPYRCVRDDT